MSKTRRSIEITRVLSFRTRRKLQAYLLDKSTVLEHPRLDSRKIKALFKAMRSGRILIAETNTGPYFLIKEVAVDVLDALTPDTISKLHRVAKKYPGKRTQDATLPYSITGPVEPHEKLRTAAVRCIRSLNFQTRITLLESLQGESIIQSAIRQRKRSKNKLGHACLLFRLTPEDVEVEEIPSLPWFPSFRRYFRFACIIPEHIRKNRMPKFKCEEEAVAHRGKRVISYEWELEKDVHAKYSFLHGFFD